MKDAIRLKVIRTDNTNPYINLATEEYLTMNAAKGEVTLFLWQNAHTVVIGKNQNPWRECNVEGIKADGIYLARRMSGGGAVYHDLGNLNFTFIARDGLYDIEKQTDVILLACRLMGIKAAKTGRNDLVIEGRKFSGHAYFSSAGYNYHHGTIMLDVNGEDLPKYLQVSDAKLKSKGVQSVRSRVVNIREYVKGYESKFGEDGEPIVKILTPARRRKLIDEMQSAMIRAAERTYGAEAEICELPATPQDLIEKYSSEEWRLGTRIPFEKSIEHKFEWGEVEIQLAMKGEYIENCRIYSDALDTEMFGKIEELLKGCRYDAATIAELERPEDCSANACELLKLIAANI
ncbi:MAG: lipoate--protein ligase [Clostridiales bacterium]|nr:lipoate--protein ligase [Candidatus Crickella caballi]